MTSQAWISKITCTLLANQKRDSSMYNNCYCLLYETHFPLYHHLINEMFLWLIKPNMSEVTRLPSLVRYLVMAYFNVSRFPHLQTSIIQGLRLVTIFYFFILFFPRFVFIPMFVTKLLKTYFHSSILLLSL